MQRKPLLKRQLKRKPLRSKELVLISKFLVIGKHVYYSSSKAGFDHDEGVRVIDLLMPIELYWETQEILKKANYLISSNEESTDIKDLYKVFFKKLAAYAIREKDRNWMYDRSK